MTSPRDGSTIRLRGSSRFTATFLAMVLGVLGLWAAPAHALPAAVMDDPIALEGAGSVTLTVDLQEVNSTGGDVTIDYATSDYIAVAGEDYVATSGTLVFTTSDQTQTITVPIIDDAWDEPTEPFIVTLSNYTGAGGSIVDASGLGQIDDDDPTTTLSIADTTVAEGDAGTTTATFTITLNPPSGESGSVHWATGDITARNPADYRALSGVLALPARATTGTINIPVVGDAIDEPDEQFFVNIWFATMGNRSDFQGVATITDDDEESTGGPSTGGPSATAGDGYWVVDDLGATTNFGDALGLGFNQDPTRGGSRTRPLQPPNAPVVGLAPTSTREGLWLTAADGGVFTFGDAGFHGSLGGTALNAPVVGIAATDTGDGYWLLAADGGVFTFGDAGFHGSLGGTALNAPVVGIAATDTGDGYWLVAADGGVFTFGDAGFHGSLGGIPVNAPVVGIAATETGDGYWLFAEDGGVFTFGDAQFEGSGTDDGLASVVAGARS